MELREQEAVVEAVLFTMGRSVEIRQLAAALECGEKEAEAAAERLKSRYEEENRGMQILRLIVPAYATFVFIEIYSGALRAMGDVFIPMLMTCGGVCILRILWILVVVPMNSSIQTIMFSYPISWILTSILFFIYFHRKQGKLPAR